MRVHSRACEACACCRNCMPCVRIMRTDRLVVQLKLQETAGNHMLCNGHYHRPPTHKTISPLLVPSFPTGSAFPTRTPMHTHPQHHSLSAYRCVRPHQGPVDSSPQGLTCHERARFRSQDTVLQGRHQQQWWRRQPVQRRRQRTRQWVAVWRDAQQRWARILRGCVLRGVSLGASGWSGMGRVIVYDSWVD